MHCKTLICSALTAAVASAQASNMTLTAALNGSTDLSSLSTLISSMPGLMSSLGNATNITLLAPSNNALSTFLNSTAGSAAAKDPGMISAVLMYHVLNGTYYASNFTDSPMFLPTMLTNTTYSNVTGGQVVEAVGSNSSVTFYSALKENSTVTQSNLNFTGGVIHVVDTLLMVPQNVTATAQQANLTSLAGAVQQLKLASAVDGLSDVTIFAPNNEAFQSIGSALSNLSIESLTSILEYHIVNGTVDYSSMVMNGTNATSMAGGNLAFSVMNGSVFVNSAKVINPNILVAGGVMHVIDSVLNPNNTMAMPNATETTASAAFSGATSASDVPFTSGIPTPTSSVPAAGTATTGGAQGAGGAGGAAPASSSSKAGAVAMQTGAVGAAALFGGAALMANW